MPVTYQIDRECCLVRTRCTGDVTFGEVIGHFRDLEGEASLPARLDVLLDITEMRSVPESEQLPSVAWEVESLGKKVEWGSCALVAASDLLFGMGRVFQAYAERHFTRFKVVRELEEAERWLASFRPSAT